MRFRSLACSLPLLALAACDRSPVGGEVTSLFGAWTSDVMHVSNATTPDGPRNLERTETWRFSANGRYLRQGILYDPASGRSYTEYADLGTYTVPRDRVVELEPEQEFYTSTLQPAPNPVTLQPASGFVHRYSFGVDGDVLSVSFICPADANCIESFPLPLHRTHELLAAESP